MKNIRITWDGTTINYQVAPGTTGYQVANNAHVRALINVPANVTALVNGQENNLALNDGDEVTFIQAASKKAA